MKAISATALAALFASASGPALAQATPQQLAGGWTLVSLENIVDGKKVEAYGPRPVGYQTFSAGGRFTVQLMAGELPRFASNNRATGTADENAAVVKGSLSYFGTYKVLNEQDGTIELRIESATFPNFGGTTQKRLLTVQGDTLTVKNAGASSGGSATLVWQRAK